MGTYLHHTVRTRDAEIAAPRRRPPRNSRDHAGGKTPVFARAADGTSNNLIEADNGSSDADFLNKMRIALREAKESKACLQKIRMAPLANAAQVAALGLEQEADELCAIYSTIIMNMEQRVAREKAANRRSRSS
jgi:four helix bundle protein